MVSTWFQVLLTPLAGVLFTFQSPYLFTIGRRGVLSLGGWSPRLHTEFHELRATLGKPMVTQSDRCRIRDCHPLWCVFPYTSASDAFVTALGSRNPGPKAGLGYVRVRSPLLTESRLISFPPGTEMFQFPGFARTGLCIQPAVTPSSCEVTPGFPIRTSPDQCSFANSPELIAGCHLLHRLSTPRHPPCTLCNLIA